MGAFADLFGKIPRVQVLEAFAEAGEESLSAPDVVLATGISRRAAYLIVKRYVHEGLLVEDTTHRGHSRLYRLNHADVRARSLELLDHVLTLGSLESLLKRQSGLSQGDVLSSGILAGGAPSRGSGPSMYPQRTVLPAISELYSLTFAALNPHPYERRVLGEPSVGSTLPELAPSATPVAEKVFETLPSTAA